MGKTEAETVALEEAEHQQRLAEIMEQRRRQFALDQIEINGLVPDPERDRRAAMERIRAGMPHLARLIADLEAEVKTGQRVYRSVEGVEFLMEPYKSREVVEEELRELKRQLRECRDQESRLARQTFPPVPTPPAKKNLVHVVEDPSGPPDPGAQGW